VRRSFAEMKRFTLVRLLVTIMISSTVMFALLDLRHGPAGVQFRWQQQNRGRGDAPSGLRWNEILAAYPQGDCG